MPLFCMECAKPVRHIMGCPRCNYMSEVEQIPPLDGFADLSVEGIDKLDLTVINSFQKVRK